MKKLISLLLIAVVSCLFCGCTETNSNAVVKETGNYEESSVEEKEQSKEQKFGLNETAVFDNLKFTAIEVRESKGENFFEPKTGNIFVGIKFTIENISDKEQSVSTLLLFNAYANDVKCEYSLSASCVFDEGTLDGSIAPGKKLVGWYALEVPQDWANIELNIQADWLSNNSAKFFFEK